MATFEHAVFTSARTARGEGYHLIGHSSGICEDLARELSRWGPSHNCLLETEHQHRSINFFGLADASFCVSSTMSAGAEHSGRVGARMLTHFLVASREALAEFANDPFAILLAAEAIGVLDEVPDHEGELKSVSLSGGSVCVDSDLLARATARFDADQLARAITALISTSSSRVPIALSGDVDFDFLLQSVIHCLPVACRSELSFSTGLKHSHRRPFDIIIAPNDRIERHRLERQVGVTIVDVTEPDTIQVNRWAARVSDRLRAGQIAQLTEEIAGCDKHTSLDTLDQQAACATGAGSSVASARQTAATAPPATQSATAPCCEVGAPTLSLHTTETPHGEVVDRLGLLDDVVLEAISGKPDAARRLRQLWPQLCEGLDPSLIDESKEQYLRYAVEKWREQSSDDSHDPAHAVVLLDIIGLLFGPDQKQ